MACCSGPKRRGKKQPSPWFHAAAGVDSFVGVPAGVPLLLRADANGMDILAHRSLNPATPQGSMSPGDGKLLMTLQYCWLDSWDWNPARVSFAVRSPDGARRQKPIILSTASGEALCLALTARCGPRRASGRPLEPVPPQSPMSKEAAAPMTDEFYAPADPERGFAPGGDGGTADENSEPQWHGRTTDGVNVGVIVDSHGFALIELETQATIAEYDLFAINGWGATDSKLQLVIGAEPNQETFEIWTSHGIAIIGALKLQAQRKMAEVEASKHDYPDQQHADNDPQLGDDQFLGDEMDQDQIEVGFDLEPQARGGRLPDGWTQQFSDQYEEHYWFNTITGESTWEQPELVDDGPPNEPEEVAVSGTAAPKPDADQEGVDSSQPGRAEELGDGGISLQGHTDAVHGLYLFEESGGGGGEGQLLASGSADGMVRLWYLSTRRESLGRLEYAHVLGGHSQAVRCLTGVQVNHASILSIHALYGVSQCVCVVISAGPELAHGVGLQRLYHQDLGGRAEQRQRLGLRSHAEGAYGRRERAGGRRPDRGE